MKITALMTFGNLYSWTLNVMIFMHSMLAECIAITKRCTKIVGISVLDQFTRLTKDTDTTHVWLVLSLGSVLWTWTLKEHGKLMLINTCIFHMVVNSSKESLVPRNSTSTLIRSQYWDWWRLPARKVRNLKQNVYNIYMEEVNPCTYTGNHPVPMAGNAHDPATIPETFF